MLIKTHSCALMGVAAIPVTIEVNIENGISFFLVGLPDSAIKESQQRIDTALKNNGYKIPGKKIVINMGIGEAIANPKVLSTWRLLTYARKAAPTTSIWP